MTFMTVQDIEISRNFLMWKFCRNPQFPAEFREDHPKLWGSRAFPQNFYTREFDEITVI